MKNTEDFQKIKHKILSIYPNAYTKITKKGRYYLVDEQGYRILNDEYRITDQDTLYEAWKKTLEMLWNQTIILRNNRKFDEDKMMNNIMKKIKEKTDTFYSSDTYI